MSAYLPYEANRARLDDVLHEAGARRAAKPAPAASSSPRVAIRRVTAADRAVQRLAVLDSARPLLGDALIAEVGGEPQAAIEIATGTAVADPFRPTAHLVNQLRDRAKRLAEPGVTRRWPRLLPRFAQ
jgi:hypothetical protein